MWKRVIFAMILLVSVGFTTADGLFGLLEARGETVTIPNLCGQSEETMKPPAWATLITEYRYDDQAPAGEITAQAPAAGSQRRITDRHPCEITVTVSLGVKTPTVPPLVGQDGAIAAATLRNLGLHVKTKTVQGGERGTVARTEPTSGVEIAVGSEVTLYLYGGESAHAVSVPDLSGLSRSRALLTLYLAGLSAGDLWEEPSEDFGGAVIRQSPPAGNLVPEGTRVSLVFGQQTPSE